MPKNYQVVHTNDKKPLPKSLDIAKFLAKDGQVLLPMLDLLTNAECALDDLIHTMGRATIEAILMMSAAEVAGPKQQGKKTDRDIAYHGKQGGRVMLKERQLQVSKPRLRHRNPKPGESGEVEIPAYQIMNSGDATLADRMLQIIMAGVSTRKYAGIIPEMAHTVGVSKSQISRATIEAGEEVLKALAEKTFHDLEIVAVWIDGIQIGDYNVVCAVGVDISGEKHVLGVRQGATENAEVVKPLLEDLVARGLHPSQRRLFVLDGAKALRCAVNAVFGDDAKVQRCRNHKIRNVVGHLPKDQKDQARLTMKAGFRLGGKQGKAKLEQYAKWLERDQPGAAASLREGLDEMFTIDDLGLPPMLKRCLGTTNIIDNSHSAARQKIHRVTNWQSGDMAVRWTASALVSSSKNFRKVMGYKDLWMLKANLQPNEQNLPIAEEVKVG